MFLSLSPTCPCLRATLVVPNPAARTLPSRCSADNVPAAAAAVVLRLITAAAVQCAASGRASCTVLKGSS
jgi:hypothetical protein